MSGAILAIDPGSKRSAWVEYASGPEDVLAYGREENSEMLGLVQRRSFKYGTVAIETPYPRGMPTSWDEMWTMVWLGRFVERAWGSVAHVYRHAVKLHLCGVSRARDSNIRQALIDRYGGEREAIGGIKCGHCKGKGWRGRGRPTCTECNGGCYEVEPGPLYGITGDVWQALAVAVTYAEIGDRALVPPLRPEAVEVTP